jgi:hypothetical protein
MNFDLMRLVAALLVVVSHTFPLAGQAPFRIMGVEDLGALGVSVFFVLSGYLVSASYERDPKSYLLKRILYGWDDRRALELLRTVRAAMAPGSVLMLMETLVESGNEFSWGKLYDLLLVAMGGGGARSREQLAVLFAEAGLETVRVIPTRMLPILEARAI